MSSPQPKATRIQTENRERILDAAEEVFADNGFKGSTLDQIARRAGMSKPNLLYYYGNKQALYLAALGRTLDVWLEPLKEFDPEGEPDAQIRGYIRRKLELSRSHPLASRVFANEIIQGAPVLGPVLRENLRVIVDDKASVIRGWMEQGRLADIDPYHFIFSIWAVTQHYADFAVQVTAVTGKGLDDDDFRADTEQAVLDILLSGLLPRK